MSAPARRLLLCCALALFVAVTPSAALGAADEPAPTEIAWQQGVTGGFELARKEGKPLFIAINAAFVDGGRAEPAGKELRENTYRAAAVVAKSAQFVCVMLKPDGTSADYGELRSRFGMEGLVVSPQHVFVHADGTLIDRHEYWPHPHGQASVDALLKLMDAALAAHRLKTGAGAPPPTPADGGGADARAAWLRDLVAKLFDATLDPDTRAAAGKELIRGDQQHDALEHVCRFLAESRKDKETPIRVELVRALGKPGLEYVVPTLNALLDDKHEELRSNVAVTLEYVGSQRSIDALTKRLGKEKDEETYNNVARALGRCGAMLEPVRKTLLREATSAKSDKLAAGPCIGLAYFEKDAETARGIEKLLEKYGGYSSRRTFLVWALTEVRDRKSADVIREKLLKRENNMYAIAFLQGAVSVISGADEGGTGAMAVEGGLGWAIGAVGGIGGAARRDRDPSEFKPKGEVAPRGPGGRGGPGGVPGGPGMGD